MKKITTLFAYILPFFIAAQTPNSTGGNALKGDIPFDVVLQLDPNKKNNKWRRNLKLMKKLMDLMENSPKGITNNHL